MKKGVPDEIVIIGAGPTGLGAALTFEKAGVDWILLEESPYFGGLSASFKKDGFQWDIGGHVIFSHYKEYDHLLAQVIPVDRWLTHKRAAFVNVLGAYVPYPFQYNLDSLPEEVREECLQSILDSTVDPIASDNTNFLTFLRTHFGVAISKIFMVPYNKKIWAHPLEEMSTQWLGERVPLIDARRAMQFKEQKIHDDKEWGPNNTFQFPLEGGTGEIWRLVAAMLPKERLMLNKKVVEVRASNNTLVLSDGVTINYDALVSTMPLDLLINMSDMKELRVPANNLLHTSTYVVGLGMMSPLPRELCDASWIYFPEPDVPFYRVTVFSNYSPLNAKAGHWSLMVEVSESRYKRINHERIVKECIAGCILKGLIQQEDEVTHTWSHRAEYGYPVPILGRDEALAQILPSLEERGIFSRGRFGAWKYEVGNMDHSFMQGVEVARRILDGQKEITVWNPDRINNQGP